ncbi:MAG: Gfo/Idh/MocA family oxidoreductase [Verrucomicrobiales bacterium]|nr:Gfo/Idh/MocA family oxidoreductase [Verrucomicrobiales bacterium]
MPRRDLTRREFIAETALASAALVTLPSLVDAQPKSNSLSPTGRKRRYVIVGLGARYGMFRDAILKTYAEHNELVGLCDINEGRLRLAQSKAREIAGVEIPGYHASEFERMIRETRPDTVIVTTKDSAHDAYIVRAMELGCDVITEKPMTIDEKKCRAILNAVRKTGRRCRVTFNYRYSPPRTQIKELLMSGVIGEVLSVDFQWLLNTHHGADYFRRWHSQKAESGGLLVHKATHHFDLVNWWLSAVPVSVMATGKREFYTPKMAKRLGLQSHHERCLTCPEKQKCTFCLDLTANKNLKELYLDNEKYDGYFRDRCVFRPDIDIEDTMNVLVTYDTGTTLCYTLNAFNAWEGYTIRFNGTKGQIEHGMQEQVYISGDGTAPGTIKAGSTYIRIYPLRGSPYEVEVWKGEGAHGGGDKVMLDDLFLPEKPADKYLRAADHRSGAWSILTGVAANKSIVTGRAVKIAELVSNIGLPEYPPMPTRDDPLPMPPPVQRG